MAVLVEVVILVIQGKKDRLMRWDDSFSSLAAGVTSLMPLLLFRNIEASAYSYVYHYYRVYELPWDSAWTWWLCMLGVDLGYYWVHRMAHEMNFMWAAHQVHHSSEDYNLITALRQSVLQRYSSWIFYLPMAFFMPPSLFATHVQFNLLYQFWIHTEAVGKLGPLEWILNTPSHHRVHHGRNRYCIDKNYAGVFIIWDRMFGTFTSERDNDDIAYGLVHPLQSWNPIYTQFCHWMYLLETAGKMEGLSNKVSVFLKGPGWSPGKPRLGQLEDIPDIHAPQPRYETKVSRWLNLYIWTHFVLALAANTVLGQQRQMITAASMMGAILFILWLLTNIGFLYESKAAAAESEFIRCLVYIGVDAVLCGGTCHMALDIIRYIYYFSAVIWLVQIARNLKGKPKTA